MTKMPKQIWAEYIINHGRNNWRDAPVRFSTKYVRADIVEKLVEALEFYANENSWIPTGYDRDEPRPKPVELDNEGDKARAVLAVLNT